MHNNVHSHPLPAQSEKQYFSSIPIKCFVVPLDSFTALDMTCLTQEQNHTCKLALTTQFALINSVETRVTSEKMNLKFLKAAMHDIERKFQPDCGVYVKQSCFK